MLDCVARRQTHFLYLDASMFLSNISKNFFQFFYRLLCRKINWNLWFWFSSERKTFFEERFVFSNGAQIYVLRFRFSKLMAIYFFVFFNVGDNPSYLLPSIIWFINMLKLESLSQRLVIQVAVRLLITRFKVCCLRWIPNKSECFV